MSTPDVHTTLTELMRRLDVAERVCWLVGITAAGESERDKALTQAYMGWSRHYRSHARPVTDEEIAQLAARRDVIRDTTIARLHRETRDRLDAECRDSLLEAIYERQHEPEAFAAHQWGAWRPVKGHEDYESRDCADEQCRRVQTRRARPTGTGWPA